MSRSKIKINQNAAASRYAYADEKIIEFSSPNGGGLMAFRLMPDGKLRIEIYRQDPTVEVTTGTPDNF